MHIHLPESAVTLFQRVLSHLNNGVKVTPGIESITIPGGVFPMQCDLSNAENSDRVVLRSCTICPSTKCHLLTEVVQCGGQKSTTPRTGNPYCPISR